MDLIAERGGHLESDRLRTALYRLRVFIGQQVGMAAATDSLMVTMFLWYLFAARSVRQSAVATL